jgi:hypothetical protein
MQAHALAPAYPHADLQPLEPVESMHALMVHEPPLPWEHDLDAQVTESWARWRCRECAYAEGSGPWQRASSRRRASFRLFFAAPLEGCADRA